MPRSLTAAVVVVVGLLLLLDFIIINPVLVGVADALLLLVVLLAAAAALAGGAALVTRHAREAAAGGEDRAGSIVLLVGFGAMLVAGFYPGSRGAGDPAVLWLVDALLGPLVASLFAMLFIFTLVAASRGMALRSRQMRVMLIVATAVLILLLPVGGGIGDLLASAAGWALAIPIGGVFRGLLIGVGVVTAIHAARIILSVQTADE